MGYRKRTYRSMELAKVYPPLNKREWVDRE
jgi:hypothetical protein